MHATFSLILISEGGRGGSWFTQITHELNNDVLRGCESHRDTCTMMLMYAHVCIHACDQLASLFVFQKISGFELH